MKTFTTTYTSPLGPIVIESDGEAITSLRFCDEPENTVSTDQGVEVLKEAFPKEAATTPSIIAETLRWLDDYFAGKRMENATTGKKEGCRIAVRPKGTAFQQAGITDHSLRQNNQLWRNRQDGGLSFRTSGRTSRRSQPHRIAHSLP